LKQTNHIAFETKMNQDESCK